MKRREFVKALAVLSVTGSFAVAQKKDVKMLHGDGVNDDAGAIQALTDGQAVLFQGKPYVGRSGNVVRFPAGVYAFSRPVSLFDGCELHGDGVRETRFVKVYRA